MQQLLALKTTSNMAKSKQTEELTPQEQVASNEVDQTTMESQTGIAQDSKIVSEDFLFAIGSPEGDIILKVGTDGKIVYLKDGTSLDDASKAFWNSFESILPVTAEEVFEITNDADLGAYIRARMNQKINP